MSGKWVALTTFVSRLDDAFYEAGGIYGDDCNEQALAGSWVRPLQPGEHVVVCPRCGQEFAADEESTAEANRDLHFDGDEDVPSICRNVPTPLRLVSPASGT